MSLLRNIGREDAGFTLVELIMGIVLTAILANLFGQVMATTAEMYAKHTLRKNGHIDSRRALEMLSHDLREWNSWQNAATATALDFNQVELYQRTYFFSTYTYYDYNRTGYAFTSNRLIHQRADEGAFSNQIYLIDRNVVMGQSAFTTTVAGTKTRVTADIRILANGQYYRVRTTIFPRRQGG